MSRPFAAGMMLALLQQLAAHAEPIPFEVLRLQDNGGRVEVDFQLLLPPANPAKPAWQTMRTRLLQDFFPDEAHPAATPPRELLARTQAALLADFDAAYGGDAQPTQQRWHDHRRQRVFFESPGLLVVEHATESYLGGAHPNGQTLYLLFEPATGRDLVFSDLFQPGEEAALTPLIKAAIREKMKVGDLADLNPLGFWEKDIRPQNLFVDAEGIGFHYNTYEIAPYVMGETVVRLPWERVRGLLKPDGPLAVLAPAGP